MEFTRGGRGGGRGRGRGRGQFTANGRPQDNYHSRDDKNHSRNGYDNSSSSSYRDNKSEYSRDESDQSFSGRRGRRSDQGYSERNQESSYATSGSSPRSETFSNKLRSSGSDRPFFNRDERSDRYDRRRDERYCREEDMDDRHSSNSMTTNNSARSTTNNGTNRSYRESDVRQMTRDADRMTVGDTRSSSSQNTPMAGPTNNNNYGRGGPRGRGRGGRGGGGEGRGGGQNRGGGQASARGQPVLREHQANTIPEQDHKPFPVEEVDENDPLVMAPKKPKADRTGKEPVRLLTNFFPLEVKDRLVYRYDAQVNMVFLNESGGRIEKNLTGAANYGMLRQDRAAVVREALRIGLEKYGILRETGALVHDGTSIMFSNEDLDAILKAAEQENPGGLVLDPSDFSTAIQVMLRQRGVKEVLINVSASTTKHVFNIRDISGAITRHTGHVDSSIKQFYEMLTNQSAVNGGKYVIFNGGKLYDHSCPGMDLGNGQRRLEGIIKGAHFVEGERDRELAALCIDATVGTFYIPGPLINTLKTMDRNVDKNRTMEGWLASDIDFYVKGVTLEYVDENGKRLSFMATGVSEKPIVELEERDTKGNVVKALEKFPANRIRYPGWPAIIRSHYSLDKEKKKRVVTRKEFFPMELLQVAPYQRVPLHKQPKQKAGAMKPHERLRLINRDLEYLDLASSRGKRNNLMEKFGVSVGPALYVDGFRRMAPEVIFGRNRSAAVHEEHASWRTGGMSFSTPATLDIWVVGYDGANQKNVEKVVGKMKEDAQRKGIRIADMRIERVDASAKTLSGLVEWVKKTKKSALVTVMQPNTPEYDTHRLLKLLERKHCVPTQQIDMANALKSESNQSLMENLLAKMNIKAGGVNYRVQLSRNVDGLWMHEGKLLVVGYDVSHPPPQTQHDRLIGLPPTQPSTVGFSYNGTKDNDRFIGDYYFQEPKREQVADKVLNSIMKNILKNFSNANGRLPESIIFVRDGVSEGQYQMVLGEELPALREACEEFGEMVKLSQTYAPKITYIVATKRHHTRFFEQGDRGVSNPRPLTVVDSTVTAINYVSCYIQSHKAIQGTASPTKYVLLKDEHNLSSDSLHAFLVGLCFEHQISSGPTSIPEPVYQADEWAKRGKDNFIALKEYYASAVPMVKVPGQPDAIDYEKLTSMLAYSNCLLKYLRCV